MQALTKQAKPFHQSIIHAIERANPRPTDGEICRLFVLISETAIPEGHDAIIAAINRYFRFPGADKWEKERRRIIDDLDARKADILRTRAMHASSDNMQAIEAAAQELAFRISVRMPTSPQWQKSIHDQMVSLRELLNKELCG